MSRRHTASGVPTTFLSGSTWAIYGNCCAALYQDGGGATCGYCGEFWPTVPLAARTWPG